LSQRKSLSSNGEIRQLWPTGDTPMKALKMIVVVVLSWIAGMAAYLVALWILWRQTVSLPESMSLAGLLAFALMIAVPSLYLPVMYLVKKRRGGTHPASVFALVGCLLGAIPLVIIFVLHGGLVIGAWESSLRRLLSPEAQLLYVMFITVGVVIGYGFAITERSRP
jgi:hypothetical protein